MVLCWSPYEIQSQEDVDAFLEEEERDDFFQAPPSAEATVDRPELQSSCCDGGAMSFRVRPVTERRSTLALCCAAVAFGPPISAQQKRREAFTTRAALRDVEPGHYLVRVEAKSSAKNVDLVVRQIPIEVR